MMNQVWDACGVHGSICLPRRTTSRPLPAPPSPMGRSGNFAKGLFASTTAWNWTCNRSADCTWSGMNARNLKVKRFCCEILRHRPPRNQTLAMSTNVRDGITTTRNQRNLYQKRAQTHRTVVPALYPFSDGMTSAGSPDATGVAMPTSTSGGGEIGTLSHHLTTAPV
jgi:hypothetical protein